MASKQNIVAVVDFGSSKVAAVAGLLNESRRIEILGYAQAPSKGVNRGVVLNIEEAVEVLNEVINQVEKQFDGEIGQVDVAISGQFVTTYQYKGYRYLTDDGVVSAGDVEDLSNEALRYPLNPGYKIFHTFPHYYMVDDEPVISNPVGMAGKKLDAVYNLLAAPVAYQSNVEKVLNKINVSLGKTVLTPVATAEAVLTEDEKEAGVVLVDIGGGVTNMAIYCDGVLCHTSVIPFGGNVITKDIKEGCAILPRWAEQLKVQYGQAMGDFAEEEKVVTIPGYNGWEPKEISFRSLAYIIQARLEEIIDSCLFQIEQSGYLEKLNAGIVFTGGSAKLSNLVQLVRYRTGLDARIGFPVVGLSAKNQELESLDFCTALGLLKLSLEEEDSDYVDRRRKKKEKKQSGGGFLWNRVSKVKDSVTQGIIGIFDESDMEM